MPRRAGVRPARPTDAADLGPIFYTAFRGIAEAHGFPPLLPSVEEATTILSHLLGHRGIYGVVAEEHGRPIGSGFLDERDPIFGIGPISISPGAQDHGVGKRVMEALLERAKSRGARGMRLTQDAYHRRSLALYMKLGFEVQELLVLMHGRPPHGNEDGRSVRPARESDLGTCAELCRRVHGHERTQELTDAVRAGSATVVEHQGRLTGYATLVGYAGHQVGESTADLCALIAAAEEIDGPGINVPVRNSVLFRWALEGGLTIVQPMSLMSMGWYQPPAGAYLPSVLY